MDKALDLRVLSVPQGHTIPSGATVITENISKEKGKVREFLAIKCLGDKDLGSKASCFK